MLSEIRGLFINNQIAQDSIYESGVMVYQCLQQSDSYLLDYVEVSSDQREIPSGYDFYFFNYHPYTMPWLETRNLKKLLRCPVITMVLEVLPGDPFVLCPKTHFDLYCVLDPSLETRQTNVVAFPRPLEQVNIKPHTKHDIPVIGTFGFATRGKGFQHVVDSVNKEFDQAIIKINIPFGSFVPDSEEYSARLSEICRSRAKPGIEVVVTHHYFTKEELIDWCRQNTLNCFLYDRNMPGLAATTDQAIVSEQPLVVSKNDTFRHILAYLPCYPQWSLRQSIEQSGPIVKKMKADWSPENFKRKFETALEQFLWNQKATHGSSSLILPLKISNFRTTLENKFHKLRRKLKLVLTGKFNRKNEEFL